MGDDGAEETYFGLGGGGQPYDMVLKDRHHPIISTPMEARQRLKRSGKSVRDTNSGLRPYYLRGQDTSTISRRFLPQVTARVPVLLRGKHAQVCKCGSPKTNHFHAPASPRYARNNPAPTNPEPHDSELV